MTQEPNGDNAVKPLEVDLDRDVAETDYDSSHVRGDDAWMRDIWAAPNRAVLASYFCVGISMSFLFTPLSYYMINELGTLFYWLCCP